MLKGLFMKDSFKQLFIILVILLSNNAFAQEVDGIAISGSTVVCSNDDVQTYSALVESSQSSNQCLTYSWSVTGGNIISGAGTRTIEVDWNTDGNVRLFVTTEGEDSEEETSGCALYEGLETKDIIYLASASGSLTLSAVGTQELCGDETKTITANLGGDATFIAWYKEGEVNPVASTVNLSVTASDLAGGQAIYTARASLGSGGCSESLERSITFIDLGTANRGVIVGDANIFNGIEVNGKVTLFGDQLGELDHWERKVGPGAWEEVGSSSGPINPDIKPIPGVGTSTYSIAYSGKFYETFRYRAVLTSNCGGGTVTSDEVVIEVMDYAPDYHSIKQTTLNEHGEKIGQSAQYFDQRGRLLQSQSWDKATNEVMASEPLYDKYDRSVGQSLQAPIGQTEIGYKLGFFTSDGQQYSYEDFELDDMPEAVDTDRAGTLGWYYSRNNEQEKQVAETKYPFALSSFYEDGSGENKSASAPGDHHYLNSDRVGARKTLPVMNGELKHYREIRNLLLENESLLGRLVKEVSRDGNKRESIAYTDDSGHVIASAVGGDASRQLTKSIANIENRFEFHVPYKEGNGLTNVKFESIVGGSIVHIYDLLKDPTTIDQTVSSGFVNLSAGFYAFEINEALGDIPDRITYEVNYSDYAYNFYDNQGRLIASMAPNGVAALGNAAPTSVDQLTFTTFYEYDHQGRLIKMVEPDAGITQYKYRKDGQVRFSQNANQASYEDKTQPRFSYTEYDQLGRPIESGEYIEAIDVPVNQKLKFSKNIDGYIESVGTTNELAQYGRNDWIKTYYDEPVTIPAAFTDGYSLTQEFVQGAVSSTESEDVQTWYSYDDQGRVTWFLQQYKELVNSQDKYFLIEYDYDFFGNVTKTAFQPQTYCNSSCDEGHVNEAYWHYYEYDESNRLDKVYTSVKPDEEKYLHATYIYYKHGPLKRVDLANGLQGIDYTYTTQGWLKAINHPVRAYDPGKDGTPRGKATADVFAMTLEYFEGDYARAEANIGSIPLDKNAFPQQNNGNIRSMLFGELSEEEYQAQYSEAKEYDHPEEVSVSEPIEEALEIYAEKTVYLEPGFDSNARPIDVIIQPDQVANASVANVTGGELYIHSL